MKKGFTQHHFSGKKVNQAKTTKSGAGFTLVEMLVAVTIFVTVVTTVSTLFVHAIRAQRLNLAYQELSDQTSYVMEYMSRAIRMAMKDDIEIWGYASENCLTGDKVNYEFTGQCLKFRNYKNECQYFCLDLVEEKLVTATTTPSTGPVFTDLTSSELRVLPLGAEWIRLSGEEQTDTDQPLVTILLQIEGREEGARITIQTSISQRNLDTVKQY